MEKHDIRTTGSDTASLLVRRLQKLYAEFSVDAVSRLDEIYTQDIEFIDPVHRIHGCLGLKNYLRRMARGLSEYSITYTDTLQGPDSAYLSWEMRFAHPKLRGGRLIRLNGISHIRYTHKVYYHEDAYDMGALLYEHLPLLGVAIGGLKRNLARQD